MVTIGAFEAKTNLSSLLRRVENDKEEIIITRHNKKIARIIPYEQEDMSGRSYIIEGLREIRERQRERGFTEKLNMKDLVNEGRKR